MRRHIPADSDGRSAFENFDWRLLQEVQTYLECRSLHRRPWAASSEAWERFYRICDPLLRRFAGSCRVPRGDVDDCVQAAWREITAALPKFQDGGQPDRFAAWLYSIVHSKARDLRRYRDRHPPMRSLTPGLKAKRTSRDADPAAESEQQDCHERVERVLAEMAGRVSETSYRTFVLHCFEGLSVTKVAAALKLTVEQVRCRCSRMKQKFCLLYHEDEEKGALGEE